MTRCHPLSLTAAMARAVLDDRKAMTRRPVDAPPFHPCDEGIDIAFYTGHIKAPWQRGDILWLREPGRVESVANGTAVVRYAAGGRGLIVKFPTRFIGKSWARDGHGIPNGIFKEACRLWLKVEEVRPERVQDISEADALAEGADKSFRQMVLPPGASPEVAANPPLVGPSYRLGFERLWNSIYAKRGLGFDVNPWVWATTFSKTNKPEGWVS